jgi:hypothetical protein
MSFFWTITEQYDHNFDVILQLQFRCLHEPRHGIVNLNLNSFSSNISLLHFSNLKEEIPRESYPCRKRLAHTRIFLDMHARERLGIIRLGDQYGEIVSQNFFVGYPLVTDLNTISLSTQYIRVYDYELMD